MANPLKTSVPVTGEYVITGKKQPFWLEITERARPSGQIKPGGLTARRPGSYQRSALVVYLIVSLA